MSLWRVSCWRQDAAKRSEMSEIDKCTCNLIRGCVFWLEEVCSLEGLTRMKALLMACKSISSLAQEATSKDKAMYIILYEWPRSSLEFP